MPQVRYNVQSPPLPANWRGNLRALHQYFIENLQVLSGEATSSFVTGPNPPATDVGPWLAFDKSWRVWDSATNAYVPQFVEQGSLDRLISFAATAPLVANIPSTAIWVSGSGPGTGLGLNQWNGAAWVPVNLHLSSLNTLDGMVRVGADRTSAGIASVELWAQNGVLTAQLRRDSGTNGDLNLVNTGSGDIRINSGGRVIGTTGGTDRYVLQADGTFALINGARLSAPAGADIGGTLNVSGTTNFSGPTTFTQGIAYPSGPTGARPGAPASYAVFYDTTISCLLYFKPGVGWVTVNGSVGDVKFVWFGDEATALQYNPGWGVEQSLKGRTIAGYNGAVNGYSNNGVQGVVGEERHTLSNGEMPKHRHDFRNYGSQTDFDNDTNGSNQGPVLGYGGFPQWTNTANSGGGPKCSPVRMLEQGNNDSHNNMQPTMFLIPLRKVQ